MPNNLAGFRLIDSEHHTAPARSFLQVNDRIGPFGVEFSNTRPEQQTFFVDKAEVATGYQAIMDQPTNRTVSVFTDGAPISGTTVINPGSAWPGVRQPQNNEPRGGFRYDPVRQTYVPDIVSVPSGGGMVAGPAVPPPVEKMLRRPSVSETKPLSISVPETPTSSVGTPGTLYSPGALPATETVAVAAAPSAAPKAEMDEKESDMKRMIETEQKQDQTVSAMVQASTPETPVRLLVENAIQESARVREASGYSGATTYESMLKRVQFALESNSFTQSPVRQAWLQSPEFHAIFSNLVLKATYPSLYQDQAFVDVLLNPLSELITDEGTVYKVKLDPAHVAAVEAFAMREYQFGAGMDWKTLRQGLAMEDQTKRENIQVGNRAY